MGYDTIFNVTRNYKCGSFYLWPKEVSNSEYKSFLLGNKAPSFFPDTAIWPTNAVDNDPFETYYFQHKAYDHFPVLGVSHWQAQQFCKWKESEINSALSKSGIKGVYVHVNLPTDAQWQSAYHATIPQWLKINSDQTYPLGTISNSQNFIHGRGFYRANFGFIQSYRLQNLMLPNPDGSRSERPTPVSGYPAPGKIYNLLGNAAEWTSTAAFGNLYNGAEYMLTMSHKIIPYSSGLADSVALNKMLRSPEKQKNHFLVKGGSWKDDIYYLQPAAIRFENEHYKGNDVGFRYVVTVSAE